MTTERSTSYTVTINHEDGSYWAEVVELPGCFASGFTLDELREALQEAISLYVTDDPEAGKITTDLRPRSMEVEEMRVLVDA
jgi:predicted RNase H-like HicB family nuclease